jgi:hypothetical protein
MGRAEREEMQRSAGALEEPSRFGQYFKKAVQETRDDLGKPWDYVYGAMQDIHRRVFEEGWFGKTTHDVIEHYQYNPRRDPGEDRTWQPQEEYELAGEYERDLHGIHGGASEHDYSPDAFYGPSQAEEQQQGTEMEEEEDLGMER